MTALQLFTMSRRAGGVHGSRLTLAGPAGDLADAPGQRRAGRRGPGRLPALLASVGATLLAALRGLGRTRAEAAIDPDEAGDATLRELGLENRSAPSPYDLADMHQGLESTRMRLFVMTGHFWRGS
jgi:hypothetical protein